MTIQVIKLESEGSSSALAKVEAHSSPVLSVAIDPLQEYFASSGCDGNVNVWSFNSETQALLLVKRWENVFPESTDICLSTTLCRMDWSPNGGKFLAIPETNKIGLHSRDHWTRTHSLQCKDLTKLISVVRYSSCGKFIGGGCSDGIIALWNTRTCEVVMKYSFASNAITGLRIQNTPALELYIVDCKGRFHWISEILDASEKTGEANSTDKELISKENSESGDVDGDVFDDGMDDDLFGILEEDDDNEFSISKIKADVGFIDDKYVGVDHAANGKKDDEDDDDRSSIVSADNSVRSGKDHIVHTVNPFSEPQSSFQPTSTPKHLEHRFMIWNNVGTIRSYATDGDEAIDVEFHDPSHHHAMHLRNQFDYSMGILSLEAIVFACEKGNDHPSKLFCVNYASWDSSKEWTIDMPTEEEILGIGIGVGWIVAATNLNRLRLYSLSGVQHFIYDFPGQVVAVSGFNNLIFLTYHCGLGVNGSQSIFYSIFLVKGCSLRPLIYHAPLPLTVESELSWIGFTEEGTPAFSDTSDTLRIQNGQLWIPFCNMREFLSGPNDHFWVVGLSQLAQNIRAIKCKGSKYPPTLPRPTQMILDAKLPLCELDTEKSQLEETMLRSLMISSISKKIDSKGFDTDEYKSKALLDLQKSLGKLFELSVKGNRDFRGSEYISLMPSFEGVQAVVKVASQHLRKNALIERLRAIAQQKMENGESEEEDDFENPSLPSVSTSSFSRYSNAVESSSRNRAYNDSEFEAETSRERRKTCAELGIENPLLQKQKEEIRNIICPPEIRNSNPFKKDDLELNKNDSQGTEKIVTFIDAWKRPSDKPIEEDFNPKYSRGKKTSTKKVKGAEKDPTKAGKKISATKDNKKQTTLFEMRGKNGKTISSNSIPLSPTMNNEDSNSNTMDMLSQPIDIEPSSFEELQETSNHDSPANNGEAARTKRKRLTQEEIQEFSDDETEPMSMFLSDKRSKFASRISKFAKDESD